MRNRERNGSEREYIIEQKRGVMYNFRIARDSNEMQKDTMQKREKKTATTPAFTQMASISMEFTELICIWVGKHRLKIVPIKIRYKNRHTVCLFSLESCGSHFQFVYILSVCVPFFCAHFVDWVPTDISLFKHVIAEISW